MGPRLVSDIHVGAGGALAVARQLFAAHPQWTQAAANAETNGNAHDMRRALLEAADLNEWFAAAHPRVLFRTASFCSERSGHLDAYDQGITFFLPNMTWLQPPGHVHAMIARAWQPDGVAAVLSGAGVRGQSVTAAQSASGDALVVRYVNNQSAPVQLRLSAPGWGLPTEAVAWTLRAGDLGAVNPPGEPDLISPTRAVVRIDRALTIPAQSFTVLEINSKA